MEKILLVAVSQNTAKRIAVEPGGRFKAKAGTQYFVQTEDGATAPVLTVKREGKDLQVFREGADKPDLTILEFYADGVEPQLYGASADGMLYGYARDDSGAYGQLALADGETVSIALGGKPLGITPAVSGTVEESAGFLLWPLAAGAVGMGTIAAVNDKHNGHKGTATSPPVTGTWLVDTTDRASPTVAGKGQPGALIRVYDQGTELGTTRVGKDGNWSFTPTSRLPDGEHRYEVVQELAYQYPSRPVVLDGFMIDTVAPAEPVVLIKGGIDHAGEYYTSTDKPIIHGNGEPGDTVTITFPTGEKVNALIAADGRWEASAPRQGLPEGPVDFFITERDPAGNETSIKLHALIDTVPPDAPRAWLDAESSIDDEVATTLATQPIIVGTTEPYADVTVTIKQTGEVLYATADANGQWSIIPVQALPYGQNNFIVSATDFVGNQSEATDLVVNVSRLTPIEPDDSKLAVVIGVLDSVGSITGMVPWGGVTDDTRPEIQGIGRPGSIVKVYDNTIELGSTTTGADGSWSFRPPQDLAEGAHALGAWAATPSDNSGSSGSANALAFLFTVDTTPPIQPTIEQVVSQTDIKAGVIADGGVGYDFTPTLSGKAEAGSTVTIHDNGTKLAEVIASNEGIWICTPANALGQGEHRFVVVATDAAGNISVRSDIYSITLEHGPIPDRILAITSVMDNAGPVIGTLAMGDQTDDPCPVISGTGTAGDTVIVYTHDGSGPQEIGRTTVDVEGAWTMQPDKPLIYGVNQLTAMAMDSHGNTTLPCPSYDIFFMGEDFGSQPAITGMVDSVGPYTGFVKPDAVTDDNQPTFNGIAQAGCIVRLYDGDKPIGSDTADALGQWCITTAPLVDGPHVVVARATNGMGKEGVPSGVWTFTVDTSPPSNVTNLVVTDSQGGPLYDGDTVDNSFLTFSGKAEPNGKVVIRADERMLAEVDVNANGEWTFDSTVVLSPGATGYGFTTEVLDQAGNKSGRSAALRLIVGDDSIWISFAGIYRSDASNLIVFGSETNETRPIFQGASKAGAIIQVYDGSLELGSTLVRADGTWSFTPDSDLGEGAHSIFAKTTDNCGVVAKTVDFLFTVDIAAPVKPSIEHITSHSGGDVQPIADGGDTLDMTPTLSGKAEAGSTVTIHDIGARLGEVVAGPDGNWTYTPPSSIGAGTHSFVVTAADAAGNTSPGSDAYSITCIEPLPGYVQLLIDDVTHDNTVDSAEAASSVRVTGKVIGLFSVGNVVTFTLDGSTFTATVAADGHWGVDVPGSRLVNDAAHQINASVEVHDSAGNAGTAVASHAYLVKLDLLSITRMGKDSGMDLAHSTDFITTDGSAGRGVYGKLAQALTAGQKVQASFDKGMSWSDALANGLDWAAVDAGAHDSNWAIQARILENGLVQGAATREVTFLPTQGNAPAITSIADGAGIYTAIQAAAGTPMTVSLAGTAAKAGDTLHVIWGDTIHDQVLTATDISSGRLTLMIPAERTSLQGTLSDFSVTAQIITLDGQASPPSTPFPLHVEGWTTSTADDLTRWLTVMDGNTLYQGGGFTITSNTALSSSSPNSAANEGLQFASSASNHAQINFTRAVAGFSVCISGLETEEGGSRVVVYDTTGKVLSDQRVLADGSGGTAHSALFGFKAPSGSEVGRVVVHGDGVDGGSPGVGLVLSSLRYEVVHRAPGYNDTFIDDVGKLPGYHSDQGHYTLTAQGTVSVVDNEEHNLDGAHLYIGTGESPKDDSAAIFTFDQPVQSLAYTLWGVEAADTNYSRLEVYDAQGLLIHAQDVGNRGGAKYNYDQVSYTAPQGLSIGSVKVSQDGHGTLLDNFTTVLQRTFTGQSLIDQHWETFFDGNYSAQAVEWAAQTFTTPTFGTGETLAGYHSDGGGFTINGNASRTINDRVWGCWMNAKQGAMYVADTETATVTFDTLRSEVSVSLTGIEAGNAAVLKVYGADGTLLDTIQMANPYGSYDIQSFNYQSSGNLIDHIEIVGDAEGTYVTSISSAVTQTSTLDNVVSMLVDPMTYFAQNTAHIHGDAGLDTLKLVGKDQILDLSAVTGENGEARISSIEKFDITGIGDNTLSISLNDVLHLGGTDLYQKDGKVQVMVDGDAGDKVQLHGVNVDGATTAGSWQSSGTTTLNGSIYDVYRYGSLDAEVLIKEAVTIIVV